MTTLEIYICLPMKLINCWYPSTGEFVQNFRHRCGWCVRFFHKWPYLLPLLQYFIGNRPFLKGCVGGCVSKCWRFCLQLCQTVRLVPEAFLEFRAILVNECRKHCGLRLAQARTLIKIDVNKTRKLYDFLLLDGQITKPSWERETEREREREREREHISL